MKVDVKESFQPVAITLESQTELDALLGVLGKSVGHGNDDDMLYNLYLALDGNERQGEIDYPFKPEGTIHLYAKERF